MSKTKYLTLLKESNSLLQMLEQYSRGLAKSDIQCAEIAWDGYIQNLAIIKAKIQEAALALEVETSQPIRINRENELSPSIAKRIRRAPEGRVREVPLTYVESLEDLDEDRMVR